MTSFINAVRKNLFDRITLLQYNISNKADKVSAFNKREIHCHARLHAKIYVEAENNYAQKVMSASTNYSIVDKTKLTINAYPYDQFQKQINADWDKLNPIELVDGFNILSDYASKENMDITDVIFDKCIDALTDSFHKMNDDQLEEVCFSLYKWPSSASAYSRNFIEVWAALDDVLSKRRKNWDNAKMLLFADHFFNLHLITQVDYIQDMLNILSKKYANMKTQEFVQAMFYISARRKSPFHMHNMELKFKSCFDELTFEEIGIICMGFFKSQTTIKDLNFIEKLLSAVIKNAKTANEMSLVTMLKLIRYSIFSQYNMQLENMLDHLVSEIPRLSFLCCVHIALAGTTSQTFHPKTINAVAQRFVDNPSQARLKDLERLALVLSIFHFEPATTIPITEVIINELRNPLRKEEIEKYSKCHINCLSYLSVRNVYAEDLIKKVLKEELSKNLYNISNQGYARSLLSLDKSVEIECKNYDGKHLKKNDSFVLAKQLTDYMPEAGTSYRLTANDKFILEVKSLLVNMRGQECVHGDHVLPHFQKGDLICCDGANRNPLQVIDVFPKSRFGTVKYPPTSDKWITLTVAGRNSFSANTKQCLGPTIMKLRQLKKIGYNPILISWFDWIKLNSDDQKISHLKACFDSIYNINS